MVPGWLKDNIDLKFLPYERAIAEKVALYVLRELQLLGVYDASPLDPGTEALAAERFSRVTIDDMTTTLIRFALSRENGNLTRAAKSLGISRAGLHRQIHERGLNDYLKILRGEHDRVVKNDSFNLSD